MIDKNLFTLPGATKMMAFACAFAVASAILCAGQAFGLARAIAGLWQGNSLADASIWIAMFAVCFISRRAVAFAEEALFDRFGARIASHLRNEMLEDVWRLGAGFVASQGAGALTARATEGIDDIEDYVSIAMPKLANAMIIPFVLLVFMFAFDWVSGLIALVCWPFIMIYMRLIGASAGREAAARYGEFEKLSSGFTDIAAGAATLSAFGAAKRFASRVFEMSERFRKLTMKTLRIAMLSSSVLDLFSTLGLAAVAIMLGFRLVDGTIAFLPALFVLVMVPEYFKPIREFAEDYHATLNGTAALREISRMRLEEDEAENAREASSMHGIYGPAGLSQLGADAGAERGICIGITGKSGSGKTTLLNTIAGLYGSNAETCGQRGGQAADPADDSWTSRISYIPQDPYIFHMSLRDNLAFYAPKATDAQILDAIERVGLSELVERLEGGLDTRLGEGGRQLSGGERQRIAFARTLLDPGRDIWLLDEPTSHLDAETEADIIDCIGPLFSDKTVLLATHSASWRPLFDMEFKLDGGKAALVAGTSDADAAETGAAADTADSARGGETDE